MKALRPHTLLGALCLLSPLLSLAETASTPTPTPSLPQEEKLYSTVEEGEHARGLDFGAAQKLCRLYKNLYGSQFFVVYCVFKESSQYELRWGLREQENVRVLGYEIMEREDSYRGIYTRSSRPILFRSTQPIFFPTELLRRSIYALEVWGLGRLDTLTWKTIYDSTKVGDLELSLTFETRGRAHLACHQVLMSKARDPEWNMVFEKARCRVELQDSEYKFRIETQNPFANVLNLP